MRRIPHGVRELRANSFFLEVQGGAGLAHSNQMSL